VKVSELNCTIFRCGIYVADGKQISQHMTRDAAMALVKSGLVIGCGNQYQIVYHNNPNKDLVHYVAEKCEGK
jgi:thioester reductase-like protein